MSPSPHLNPSVSLSLVLPLSFQNQNVAVPKAAKTRQTYLMMDLCVCAYSVQAWN